MAIQTTLKAPSLATLASFAHSNMLLALDYDGTLAPIVATPARARMRRDTRKLLTRAARLYPCVVISGRALDDIVRKLRGIPVWYLFGNHGLEPVAPGVDAPTPASAWARLLKKRLARAPGIVIEDKRYSLTIHYRNARNKADAIAAIDRAIRDLPGVRALGGLESVSLLPRDGPDKGAALRQACRLFACDSAIYVGDDATDEDAFGSTYPEELLTIRIGTTHASRARHSLACQDDIDELLRVLVDLRTDDTNRTSAPRRSV